MANVNCLEGMVCAACGSEGPFQIAGTALFVVHDDGADSYEDVEWDSTSACICPVCKHDGTVRDFRGEGSREGG